MTEAEIEGLGRDGWFMREAFGPAAATATVAQARVGAYHASRVSSEAGSGSASRSDRTQWVAVDDPELGALHEGFEALRVEVNEGAWLGLTRFDVQLAHYASGGSGYAPHLDAPRGRPGRRLTAVSFLNPAWQASDGGRLKLHLEPHVEIDPRLGHLVVFLSERVTHEVLPTFAARFAATAWYYAD